MSKSKIVHILINIVCLIFINTLQAQNLQNQLMQQQYLNRIEYYSLSKSTDSLKTLAENINRIFSKDNIPVYSILMLKICDELSGMPIEDKAKYELIQKYTAVTLQKGDTIPLQIRLKLLLNRFYIVKIGDPKANLKTEEWLNQRKNDAILCLKGWKLLLGKIDSKWNPDDLPLLSVPLSSFTNLSNETNPESIKDTVIKNDYEKAIKKNQKKIQEYNEQYEIRKIEKFFVPKATEYLVNLYSVEPSDNEELEAILKIYLDNDETINEMVYKLKRQLIINKEDI